MLDLALSDKLRIVGGARVERFDQQVDTFDPFGLFVGRVTSENKNTDVFPGLNLIYSLSPDMNLRLSGSQTVNRPEFRELAPFEFTDVVGSRAVKGNPDLKRALIRNADARWELITRGRDVVAVSGSLDAVMSLRIGKLSLRLIGENLTDSEYLFTQGSEEQRVFKLGRTIGVSFGVDVF